jgi:hypothetical protein
MQSLSEGVSFPRMSETAIPIPTGCDSREKNLAQAHESSGPRYLLSKLSRSPWPLRILVSAALVIPCFWQPIVSSADLQSHLYNAWLAKLIQDGNVHGLWIGHQSTNFVVDLLLAWLLRVLGVSGAERIVTVVLVLLFFWGGFQFFCAVRGRPAYWVAPWLAILSYGYVFQQGLLNYYFSCSVVLWLFAVLWRRPVEWGMLWAAPLLILAYLAHPLPVLWFLGVLAYCHLAQRLQLRFPILLFLGGASALFLIRGYIVAKFLTIWELRQLVYWTGADQALVYGWIYLAVALGFLLFIAFLLNEPENRWRAMVSVPAQAYFLTAVAIVVIPSSIGASVENAWAEYIAERLSLLSGVLLLAAVGGSVYRRWYLPAGLTIAAIFFGALYTDIGKQARVEGKMQELVQALPAGERVISYDQFAYQEDRGDLSTREQKLTHLAARLSSIFTGRLNSTHLLSRACLGHCFDYMNYEPSTSQFRIHAVPGNPVVMASQADVVDVVDGAYVVKAIDLPLYVLLRCGERPGDIRMRSLAEGESGKMLACPRTAAAW